MGRGDQQRDEGGGGLLAHASGTRGACLVAAGHDVCKDLRGQEQELGGEFEYTVKSHTRGGARGYADPRGTRFLVEMRGNEGSEDVRAWLQLLAAPPTLLRALDFEECSYAGTEGTSGGEGRGERGGRGCECGKELIFELR